MEQAVAVVSAGPLPCSPVLGCDVLPRLSVCASSPDG